MVAVPSVVIFDAFGPAKLTGGERLTWTDLTDWDDGLSWVD
jgi:hypothetical protein